MAGTGETYDSEVLGQSTANTEKTDLWTRLKQAENAEQFATIWLEIQCGLMKGVRRAVVVLGPKDRGPFAPVAVWRPLEPARRPARQRGACDRAGEQDDRRDPEHGVPGVERELRVWNLEHTHPVGQAKAAVLRAHVVERRDAQEGAEQAEPLHPDLAMCDRTRHQCRPPPDRSSGRPHFLT